MTQSELAALTHLKAWGDTRKFCSDITFLLVLPTEGAGGERVYGLTMVWVHPYQARVSMIDDMAKQLTQLTSTGPNWPYGPPCAPPYRGSPECYDGGEYQQCPLQKDPPIAGLPTSELRLLGGLPRRTQGVSSSVITSLPVLLSNGVTMLKGNPTFLQVDLSQSITKEQESKVPSLGSGVSPPPAASPTRALPPKAESQISMTMEVSKLLYQAVLDTSGLASRCSTPKRPGSLALAAPLLLKLEDSIKPVDTSSQVSIPDNVEMDDPILEEIHASPSPLVKTLGPSGKAPSLDLIQPQEEANKALGHLLVIRSSINAHQRKQVSDFGMACHQNESETTEAIKEAKALCAHTIRDVETHKTVLISKAKVWHVTCIKEIEDDYACALAEAENCCSTAIREAESWSASQAHSIQQSHAKDIQCLEAEAIEEERRDCLAFLTACSTALRASPPETCGIMVTPFHLLLGNAPTSTLLSIPMGVSPPEQEPVPQTPPSSAPAVTRPSPRSKWQHNLPNQVEPLSPSETTSKVTPKEPPH